jgi:hypothetical protein
MGTNQSQLMNSLSIWKLIEVFILQTYSCDVAYYFNSFWWGHKGVYAAVETNEIDTAAPH